MSHAHHPWSALVVVLIGASAALVAGALGPFAFAVLILGVGLAHTRARRVLSSRWLAVTYVPFLAVDLMWGVLSDPVLPLARLVAFLAAVEIATGDGTRRDRPLLFGFLLLVVAAAETTDVWFGAFFVAFALAAAFSHSQLSLGPSRTAPRVPFAGPALMAAASLVLGAALFFLIPHSGGGWGSRAMARGGGPELATGMSDEVSLGAIGRVKKRRDVVLRARQREGGVDPESIYWRARTFSTWTGAGWRDDRGVPARAVRLRPNRRVVLDHAARGAEPDLVADVRLETTRLEDLIVPDRAVWIESREHATIAKDDDGAPRTYRGGAPRRYRVASILSAAYPTEPPAATPVAVDPVVAAWADSVAQGATDAPALAAALVRDLSRREYSLDTRGIDPERPLASFVEGAPAHCEYFASAMAIALRQRGIPSRVVGGYLGAERIPLVGELVVRAERAHLWVEAFVPERGWVRFDPTPAAGRTPPLDALAALRAAGDWGVIAWDSWVIGLDLGDQQTLILVALDLAGAALRLAWRAAPLALLLVVAAAVIHALRRRHLRRAGRSRLPPYYARLVAVARRQGIVPGDAETVGEFADRLPDPGSARLVTKLYERERFGERPASRRELAEAERALSRLAGPGGAS